MVTYEKYDDGNICELSEGPCNHNETCCWNEEVAEAIREKKKSMETGKKEKSTEAWKEYKKSRQNTEGYFISKGKEAEGICSRFE